MKPKESIGEFLTKRICLLEAAALKPWRDGDQWGWGTLGSWMVLVSTIVAAVWFGGCAPIWAALNDYVVLMDGAWRMHHGQIPHKDFYSVLGPLPLLTLRLAFTAFGPSPDSLARAMSCIGVLLSALTMVLARRRVSAAWALLFSLVVLGVAVSPAPLGIGGGPPFGFVHQTTYAMFYNRLGWAALLPAMLGVFIPPKGQSQPMLASGEAFVFGVCLASVAGVKLNFALCCLPVLVWGCWFNGRRTAYWVGLVAGVCAFTTVSWWVLGNVAGYVTDTLTLLRVHREESYINSLLIRIDANRLALITNAILLAWAWIHQRAEAHSSAEGRDVNYLFISGLSCVGLSLFVTTFNWERSELPGLVLASLIAVRLAGAGAAMWPSLPIKEAAFGVRFGIVKTAAALLASAYLIFDLGSVLYVLAWKSRNSQWATRCEQVSGDFFKALPVPIRWDETDNLEAVNRSIEERPVVDFPAVMMTSLQFTRWINDGAELLRPHVRPSDRIFVADWLNPYNLCFNLTPASGGALLWDYRRMLDEDHHPDAVKTMQDITLVMVPRIPHLPAQSRFMLAQYASSVVVNSQKLGESRFWALYQTQSRKPEK
jgi:hypothetical protein